MPFHRVVEDRSLAYHRVIAARVVTDETIVLRARERVRAWERDAPMSREYVEAWRALLDGPIEVLTACMVDRSEHARALRQTTPFAGALSARERWRIFREVRESRP